MKLTNTEKAVLPDRYSWYWRAPFEEEIETRLRPAMSILDIGSGRAPSLPVERRPPECHYTGLDISSTELEAAGRQAYDEAVVADISVPQSILVDRFDLAVSWQVLEHVKHLQPAVDNVRTYLRPGGVFVSMLSGSYAAFSIANKVIPDRIGHALVSRTMHRTPDESPVFRAHYDQCHATGLERAFASWSRVEVRPFYRAATYFEFARPLLRAYLAYEDVVARRDLRNLASHYLVVATR
jgi:SAM-dependent methyltransferase